MPKNKAPKASASRRKKPFLPPILVGIDTEYQQDPTNSSRNMVLSYQWCIRGFDGSTTSGILHVYDGKRIPFVHLLTEAVKDALAKGVLKVWPDNLWVFAHYSAAEISMFSDRAYLMRKLSLQRGSFVTREKPLFLSKSIGGHKRLFIVRLADTKHLSPAKKQSLSDLGEVVGLPKLNIEKADIEAMGAFRERDLQTFEEYAKRDAEVALRYGVKILEYADRCGIARNNRPPLTLGSMGVDNTILSLRQQGIRPGEFFGVSRKETKRMIEASRGGRYKKVVHCAYQELYPEANGVFDAALRGYVGARNECFMFGPWRNGPYTDYDLRGAYPTSMAAIRMPDWKNTRRLFDGDEFAPDSLVVAYIEFEFPKSVRFPVFACDGKDRGLIFPRTGKTYAWGPELFVAKNLGARIEIKEGFIIPWLDQRRPFAAFVQEQTAARRKAEAEGNALDALLAKEMVNSAYGKTGQGLKNKSVFNTMTNETEKTGPSPITCPPYAGFTTGTNRALLAEILNRIPRTREVINVITDGFLTNATRSEVDEACRGELAILFGQWRAIVAGKPESIIEEKGSTPGICGVRTRLHFSLDGGSSVAEDDENEDPAEPGNIVANVGIKFEAEDFEDCPDEKAKKVKRSQLLEELFANRKPGQKRVMKRLRNGRDIYDDPNCDITFEISEHKLSMEYDFKRQVDVISLGHVGGREHLSFTTKPWDSVEEFNAFRDKIDGAAFVLKTEADLSQIDQILQHQNHQPSVGKRRPTRKQGEGRRAMATRQAQQIAATKTGTPKQIASKLTAAGIQTDAKQVNQYRKDAARRNPSAKELEASTSVLDVHHRLANALPDHDGEGLPPDAQVEFRELRLAVTQEAGLLSSAAGVSVLGQVVPVTASDGSGGIRLKAAFTAEGETTPLEVRQVRDFAKLRRDEFDESVDNESN